MSEKLLHICLVSVHGLIRSRKPELGCDADTGGQVLYVLELAKALAEAEGVGRVDLVTRRISSKGVDSAYSQRIEAIAPNANIVRIDAGGDAYIRKEELWEHLDNFAENLINYYVKDHSQPDVIHAHYADAGYVGKRLIRAFKIPLIYTAHSLGRVKRQRLLASGFCARTIESRYNMIRRISAEEQTLACASRVIASTPQEIDEQYRLYANLRPELTHVIAPGTRLSRFHPPQGDELGSTMAHSLRRFLREPEKPIILALSRADARKNIATLVHAYGQDKALQEIANLVIVLGNREKIGSLDDGAREVVQELLDLIDRYDLYGKVAYPKQHCINEVPVLYRLCTLSKGVFVNPALTEPFGLTLLEAAASGLPVVATQDGGPVDIVANCGNGLLTDPLNSQSMAACIHSIIDDWETWQCHSFAGLKGVREHYVWDAHVRSYLELVTQLLPAGEYSAQQELDNDSKALQADKPALLSAFALPG